MESERPHRNRSGSELFICFTSRNSSSMKVSSKSIHSPGRSEKFREPSLSLSSSLSRRLRSNGSMKGGQASPMFPTGSKKKGSSFETAEPSSPKVTCIGQVRVKTKKQGQKFRTRSKRRGEVSFRKTEQIQEGILLHHHQQQQQQECLPHRNQRWVHLPLSICEALRAFGSEFSCFLPCRSSCFTGEKEKAEKKRNRQTTEANATSSCRAVFARWVMTLQENDEEKRKDMELVSREEDQRRETREVVGEIEMQISEDEKGVISNEVEEEEEGRVSICIPPRNALLLMRCRSEPFRTSALANRFWESPGPKDEDQQEKVEAAAAASASEDDDDDEEEILVNEEDEDECEVEEVKLVLKEDQQEEKFSENPEKVEIREDPDKAEEEQEQGNPENAEIDDKKEAAEVKKMEEEIIVNGSACPPETHNEEFIRYVEEIEEAPSFVVRGDEELIVEVREDREQISRRPSFSSRRASVSSCTKSLHEEEEETEPEPAPAPIAALEQRVEKSTEPKVTELGIVTRTEVQEKMIEQKIDVQGDDDEEEVEVEREEKSKERESDDLLPDCLLLMMCEPKLSMEVSKETWVCSTDFIRYRPETKKVIQKDGGDEPKKRLSTDSRRLSTDSRRLSTDGRPPLPSNKQKPPTPPRRSVSKPAAPPVKQAAPPPSKPTEPAITATAAAAPPQSTMATVLEKKLVDPVPYEPFVLKRCKSEPMRSSAKLAPEACFWKNMKLEPHAQGPPSLGVGATGIGF